MYSFYLIKVKKLPNVETFGLTLKPKYFVLSIDF